MKAPAEALTLEGVAKAQNKQCGERTVIAGSELKTDPPRLPTGVFSVDYATGGGIPMHATTCFWGQESGGKSSLALNATSMVERICWRCFQILEYCSCSQEPIRMRTYWADAEGSFDRNWAMAIGANPDSYLLGLADYGEQHINIADSMLRADDCGLVVVDSLASLIPSAEADAAAESQFMGLHPRMITKMVRILKQRLIRERKRNHPCCVLFINQMRKKLGLMFGDPEDMPGGHGLKHEFSLLLRCVRKALKKGPDDRYIDSKAEKQMAERYSFAVRKAKVQTVSGVGEYIRATEKISSLHLEKGMVDDANVLINTMRPLGLVTKNGASWVIVGVDQKFTKLDDIRLFLIANFAVKQHLHYLTIQAAKQRLAAGEVVEVVE